MSRLMAIGLAGNNRSCENMWKGPSSTRFRMHWDATEAAKDGEMGGKDDC